MASNIKRNKNLINIISKSIIEELKSKIRLAAVDRKYSIVFHFNNIRCFVNKRIPIELKKNKLIAVEDSKGRVNIGFDTSDMKIHWDSDIKTAIGDAVYLKIRNAVESNYDSCHDAVVDRLKKDGEYDNLVIQDGMGIVNPEYIKKTKLYNEMFDLFLKEISNIRIYFELKDEAFKYLTKNRNFLPVVIFDPEKNELNYCYNGYVDTDREKRVSLSIGDFIWNSKLQKVRNTKTVYRIDKLNVPIYLIDCKVEGSRYIRIV